MLVKPKMESIFLNDVLIFYFYFYFFQAPSLWKKLAEPLENVSPSRRRGIHHQHQVESQSHRLVQQPGEPSVTASEETWKKYKHLTSMCVCVSNVVEKCSSVWKSTTSAPNNASPACWETTWVWGRTCTPAACAGRTTPRWSWAGAPPLRLASLLGLNPPIVVVEVVLFF